MIDDMDTRLSSLAPGARPRDEFRQNLRMVLRSHASAEQLEQLQSELPRIPHRQPRRHRVLALVAAMFVLTLVVGEGGRQLGSYDFDLVPGINPRTGDSVMRDNLKTTTFTSNQDSEIETFEQVYALEAAGIERMVEAEGWTVGEITFFTVTYGYDVDGELVTIARLPSDAPHRMSKEMMAYISSYENYSYATIEDGRATELSPEVVVIDGLPITMRKWHIIAPDGREAVYWEGFPE